MFTYEWGICTQTDTYTLTSFLSPKQKYGDLYCLQADLSVAFYLAYRNMQQKLDALGYEGVLRNIWSRYEEEEIPKLLEYVNTLNVGKKEKDYLINQVLNRELEPSVKE
jgi:hypothetical protein